MSQTLRSVPRLLALATLAAVSTVCAAETFSFALWGDMPYAKNNDAERTQAVIRSINHADVRFSIYDGDIKDGSSRCTDEVFDQAKQMFNSLRRPVVYVPGDNEWTDCHRLNNGGYNALERLQTLRKTMFASPRSWGRNTMKLEHQGQPGEKFSENTRFSAGQVVFVNLNVPGSNNGRVDAEKECTKKSARTPADCDAGNAEFVERNTANLA